MMQFAEGMQEALRVGETFATDDEAAAFWNADAPSVPVDDLVIPGAAGQEQRARLYRGRSNGPVLLYIHGGGWAGGSVALNESSARGIALESGWNVLGISYRLAPDHPFPAGLDDCRAAVDWLRTEGGALGLDTREIALGGASAGANLAMATTLALPMDSFAGLVLFYGVLGSDFTTESYRTYQNGPGLTRERMVDLFAMYDPDRKRDVDPLIAPLLSDHLSRMPPACLIAAQHDVLLDDSRAMAEAFAKAGVRHELHIEPGVTHGFINRGRLVPAARACITRAATFLKHLK